MKILFASFNRAKLKFYGTRLREYGIGLVSPSELGITDEVIETGNTPLENALIKARGYYEISNLPSLALDDGLYFDQLPDELQPGVHVKQIGIKHPSDEEMIAYYQNFVKRYGDNGNLSGYFRKGVAFIHGDYVRTLETDVRRVFVTERSAIVDPGYPLASLQIIPELQKYKSELNREEEAVSLDVEQKEILEFMKKTIQDFFQVKRDIP